ncbi:hypothetical protein CHLRE_02g143167v5 [Chlamydomonas reinhardtii]|uniref:Uncharacterized protein n=1 Tax=Chlamydomonas reinhardtii TaxID=3055 RepID=A0A2K3E4I3_CHLRE|nr:uncharacterized protein CHLRE_02g143167v5 [Chlamydomonas reinhardtii]XP_042927956.1 uncharacterized protein CHLRE_02g143167v5 [Chlamydomonas reinhardtii]PNW87705.1 hypothetical protein CHLRE_02g143167v5 [Chlamydomonas reinhardtii]PNW87706.1 hypothetical protein CHLRE_02g143167v5 [Chlamydomonas reinhardtii]
MWPAGGDGDRKAPKRPEALAPAVNTAAAIVAELQPAGETRPVAVGALEEVTQAQPQQQQGQEENPSSHVQELVSADARKGFLLCGAFNKNENNDVVAVGVPHSTMHERMQPTDLIPMAVVKVVASVSATTTVSVGGRQIKFVKAQAMVNWPLSGVYTSWEGKTPASFGCTEKQLENAKK